MFSLNIKISQRSTSTIYKRFDMVNVHPITFTDFSKFGFLPASFITLGSVLLLNRSPLVFGILLLVVSSHLLPFSFLGFLNTLTFIGLIEFFTHRLRNTTISTRSMGSNRH